MNAKDRAEAHWDGYVGPMMETMMKCMMDMSRFHYISSHIHGAKHGLEDAATKQEAPTAAVLPSTHTDPSTNCKDCFNTACVGKGRDLTCDQGCERFIPKELAP